MTFHPLRQGRRPQYTKIWSEVLILRSLCQMETPGWRIWLWFSLSSDYADVLLANRHLRLGWASSQYALSSWSLDVLSAWESGT